MKHDEHLQRLHGAEMKRLIQTILVATAVCVSTTTFAQRTTQDSLREIEASNRAAQLEVEKSRLMWQQMQADIAQRNAEIERSRAESDRFERWTESQRGADQSRKIAEQTAFDRAEAAKKAEETAEELRKELEQAVASTNNNFYLTTMLLFATGVVTYVVRRSTKEEFMQEHQKFGIVAVIVFVLISLLAVMISDGWLYKFDFLQNLMLSLRIRFFADTQAYDTYYIDLPTRYIVLSCICAAAYGLTTYLGITPVPRKKKRKIQDADPAVTP